MVFVGLRALFFGSHALRKPADASWHDEIARLEAHKRHAADLVARSCALD
jgi:hypothetical protein